MQNNRNALASYVFLVIGGLIFGAVAGDSSGPVFGAFLGYLLADNMWLKRRLDGLERRSVFPRADKIAAAVADQPAAGDDFDNAAIATTSAAAETASLATEDSRVRDAVARPSFTSPSEIWKTGEQQVPQAAPAKTGGGEEIFYRIFVAAKNFFTTGNIILKIGLIVLFFGVSFLLKYAAQRNFVPIELRLTAVCLGGLAMLAIGWRLRLQRQFYGLLLQGGGVGILYLTVFAAAKLYHLLPFVLAFGVMLGIVLLAGALAVLQDEKWLAMAGSTGGFLAPVLLSTGSGSHVALFSYYLLLNLGILGIAWFKTWRLLNLLGFVFTYVISAMWGLKFYQPAYFASVEPFLLVSFLLYAGVSILFALKQPVELKGYIDPPLVFGLPIITFAMQYGLVHDTEFGLALSAVGFGIFYLLCALLLWRRHQAMGMLVEIYLSFGVVFGSLAIPLALDGYWITAAWALEGAALIWVGVRQSRIRARVFGILLQVGAGLSFLEALNGQAGTLPGLNGIFLSSLLLAMAGLFSSYYLDTKGENIRSWERQLVIPLLLWGLCWWFGGGTREIDHFARSADKMHIFLLFICASSLLMGFTARKLAWRLLAYPPVALLPLLAVLSFNSPFGEVILPHLFAGWGALAWTVALAGQYILLRISENKWPLKVVNFYHQLSFWLILYILSAESAWFIGQTLGGRVWSFLCWGVVPAAGILLLGGVGRKLAWPVRRFEQAYLVTGSAVVVAYLCCWCLASLLQSGDPAPLPFLPLINPLEVFQVVVLLVSLQWAVQHRLWLADQLRGRISQPILYVAGAIIFLWLNAAVARTVHFFAGVPYLAVNLFHSTVFQAAISILWGLSALSIMVLSTRKMNRHIWMLGGGLLGLVVVKLFLVDLSGTGTIGRIVSFLVVGLLMLLIGYFSPLPPKQEQSA
ncbi:MAG: DUF2339 domain-containing protein [Desulfobulbaceae bacterium]|nr:DUF2339 domain-containing protein [Desulfobulbaceae bacterium]